MENEIVDIYDISYEGSGVGKLDGQVVFVPKTLKGEMVEISIIKKNKSFLLAKLSNVLSPSAERIEPRCPYFEKCGGCDFQHCSYQHERDLKTEILRKEMSKIGYIGDVSYQESKNRFFYRNKIKLEFFNGELGYFKSKSHSFFCIECCPIATEMINNSLPVLKRFISSNDCFGLKSVYFKQLQNNLSICFLFDKKIVKSTQKMIKNLKNIEMFGDFSIYFAFGEILESDSTKIFCVKQGKEFKQIYDGIIFEFDVSSFNQVNDEIAKELYDYVASKVEGKRVVNAYSGQGLLTYILSRNAKFVYGIEYQRSAHMSAEKMKEQLQDYKIENICGKVEDEIPKILKRDKIDCVVLDPSREGCERSVLNEMNQSGVEKTVYVSCNFSTLVRDLKILKDFYDVVSVKIFDMFPCTANMETVVVLRRKA